MNITWNQIMREFSTNFVGERWHGLGAIILCEEEYMDAEERKNVNVCNDSAVSGALYTVFLSAAVRVDLRVL